MLDKIEVDIDSQEIFVTKKSKDDVESSAG
jgi:hypothetical protein